MTAVFAGVPRRNTKGVWDMVEDGRKRLEDTDEQVGRQPTNTRPTLHSMGQARSVGAWLSCGCGCRARCFCASGCSLPKALVPGQLSSLLCCPPACSALQIREMKSDVNMPAWAFKLVRPAVAPDSCSGIQCCDTTLTGRPCIPPVVGWRQPRHQQRMSGTRAV